MVTGGAKGIGRAIVERFAALGDHVTALGRDERALAELEVCSAVCDVTDEQAVRETLAALEPIDVLVNNAGIAETAPLTRTSLALWRQHLDVNATGPFLCMRAVAPGMRERGGGSIVIVASTAGRIGRPYTSAYTASKHAAVGLMRAAASELAGTGVRVNAVCPTFVATELAERAVARIVQRSGRGEAETRDILAGMSPLGRLLAPEEVADAVVYLASDAAVAINGQTLVIDGGGIQA